MRAIGILFGLETLFPASFPAELGWEPVRIARAWIVLMKRLGYARFVASGGDWGDPVTEQMAVLAPSEVLGIHLNMPSAVPLEIFKALRGRLAANRSLQRQLAIPVAILANACVTK